MIVKRKLRSIHIWALEEPFRLKRSRYFNELIRAMREIALLEKIKPGEMFSIQMTYDLTVCPKGICVEVRIADGNEEAK